MDWFEKLTGFRETNYVDTKAKLDVKDGRLFSTVNWASYAIGELELVSLQTLRERVKSTGNVPGHLRVSVVEGDVRKMHQSPQNAGAFFQVRLSASAVSDIIQQRIAKAGMNLKGYSGHSLRSGFATSAAMAGVATWRIRKQTGHTSDVMLGRYIRDRELFTDNAAGQCCNRYALCWSRT